MPEYSTDVLLSAIDEALSREYPNKVHCAGHADLTSDVRLLLRCQRAQLASTQKTAYIAGGVSAGISTAVACITAVIQYLS